MRKIARYPKDRNKQLLKGQALIEFVVTVPLILAMLSLGFDFGNLLYTRHRMLQAAYEGSKLVSQVTGSYVVECQSMTNKDNCLSYAMVTRAERVLKESGIQHASVRFVDETRNDSTVIPNLNHRILGIEVEKEYSFILGRAVGFDAITLRYQVGT